MGPLVVSVVQGWEMIRQVSMHGATEEMVLYPIVAKLMGKEAGAPHS